MNYILTTEYLTLYNTLLLLRNIDSNSEQLMDYIESHLYKIYDEIKKTTYLLKEFNNNNLPIPEK